MLTQVHLKRRWFVSALAGLPLAALGATAPRGTFVCPPCGLACDSLSFQGPGSCPKCGMTLIPKAQQAAPYGVAQFPNHGERVKFPFELLANAIFIPAVVNGKGPYLFALDTGSMNSVVASEVSSELGLVTGRQFYASGAGSDSNVAARVETLEFVLPQGVERTTKQGAIVSMAGLWPLIGRRFYGDIGYDIIAPFVVEIDYGSAVITLHDPATYHYAGRGTTLPFRLLGGSDPQVDGFLKVAGQSAIPVRFTIDTGAGGTIVSSPLVNKYNLLAAVGKTVATQDEGIGGAEPTEVAARLLALQIGPYVVERPVVALSRDTAGSLADEAISVNLGGNILRRFTVIIDYVRKQLTLEPNAHLGEPFAYDASGLLLAASGPGFHTVVVRSILPNSPASESRLQKGDRIVAIDGRPTQNYALWQLQELLTRSETTVTLSIQRSDETFVDQLALRSLI